ncbi:cytochrome P450 [Streptomyces purpurogeneiscleroticus]|uniref:cytochrome P450 n=1 Tax=Streptomyces purpurogeneiscleroticus TaxID=68259 RepID=UPI001CBCD59C|nr:cytochrome P450 [Streptomyces purpurogeneiscleroticus]MBZ4020627.1 cytochrome P450 [Streptomyces purpurogeneiscleroticus]
MTDTDTHIGSGALPSGAATHIPGPKGLPLLGSMFELQQDSLGAFLRARRDHGDVVRVSAGPPGLRTVLHGVFSAEGVQQVLATESANFRKDNPFYEEVRAAFGNGLLTSQDADYLRQRRLVQPLFTKRRVDGYADAIAQEADAVVERWGERTTVDLVGEMSRLALRTVARILFGADVEAAVEVIHRSFPVINSYALSRAYAPVNVPREWPTPGNRRAMAAIAEVYAVCDRIIAERRAAPEGPVGDDLLTLLAQAGSEEDGSLDATEIRDQVLVFLLAGHETTATSMAFTLHLLSRHPEEQTRARQEVDEVLGDRAPTAADLERLPYLTQVLKEGMRLYPAAPVVGRRAVADTEIGGYRIRAGSDVVVAPWVTHRNPDLWEDPERFDPERFTPERVAARHRYAWFPFGGGPRACIGQHFSMLESVLALATLLRGYELEAADDAEVPVAAGITLQAKGPARVRLRARREPSA